MTSATSGGRTRSAAALIVLGACSAIGAAGVVRAAGADARAFTVRYSDLDPSTDAGARALYARIAAAAYRVCAPDNMLSPDAMATARVCREDAIARAVRDIHSPRLASLSAEHRYDHL